MKKPTSNSNKKKKKRMDNNNKTVELPKELVMQIAQFLGGCPYREVAETISYLMQEVAKLESQEPKIFTGE